MPHADQRDMGCNARVKYSHNLHNSVQIILFLDKINIMQYFYLQKCKLFHIPSLPAALGTSHACASCENYENKSRNYLIVGF